MLFSCYISTGIVMPCDVVESLATFAANVPVIFVTFRSRRFENDSVAKIISSLAVSDTVNGAIAACCAGVAWSLPPGEQVPTWLLRTINTGLYTFGLCSTWHLAAVSVVKCTVIVRPLTHFSIFTDRVLKAIICSLWTLSLAFGGCVSNIGVTDSYFDWITMIAYVKRQNASLAYGFGVFQFIVSTMIITAAYAKMFLVVRRQVSSMPSDVLGSFGSRTIFGSSVRSAKNLFVMCAAYYLAYSPVYLRIGLRARGLMIPDAVDFAISWIYRSSAALDGFLYIVLHSSVRRELRYYLCPSRGCRRRAVGPAALTHQPVAGDAAGPSSLRWYRASVNRAQRAPVVTTSSCQHEMTERIPPTVAR